MISSGTGTNSSPMRNFSLRVMRFQPPEVGGPDPLDQRLDDAVKPNVTSSELNGVSAKRAMQPVQRRAEREERRHDDRECEQRVDAARRRELVAEVGGEERKREMREVDQAQQAPAQRQAEPEQAVQRADEDAREHRLRRAA